MKNLKRTLCLTLVLALCLGLVGTVSATGYASYPDADKVTYTEAMDVLTSLGIIEGSNGYLNPTDYVTREQAAKMIAYLCLGKTAAEALSASTAVFEDVPASRWSAGYINYCVSKGIISGVGDTNKNGKDEFQPAANVTANQFVKMLLCALGYGANKEFNGTYWATATQSCGSKVGAYDGSKATNYNAAATREEAMLYAFNILTGAMTVTYSSLTGSYYSGSSPLSTVDSDDEYLYTLGYQVFGLYSYSGTDAYGRTYRQWKTSSSKSVSDKYYDTATLTYTTSVTSGALYTALGSAYAGSASYTLNGVKQSSFTIAKGSASSIGGNGVLTLVYADSDTGAVRIVSVVTYLGVIEDVDGDDSTVRVYFSAGSSGTYTFDAADFSGLSEGEVVLAALSDDEISSMTKATSVTGVLSAVSSSYLKIDGTAYYKSSAFGGLESAASDGDYSDTYTFYLDAYGYVLGDTLYSESGSTSDGYVYVTASEYTTSLSARKAAVEVTYMDGSTDVLYLNIWKSGSSYYYTNPSTGTSTQITSSNGAAVTGLTTPGFYRYSKDTDGYVTLKAVSTSSQYAAGWLDVQAEVTSGSRYLFLDSDSALPSADFGRTASSLYITSSTVLKIIGADGDVTSLTGYSNIEGYLSGSDADVLILYSGSIAGTIYVLDSSYTATSSNYALYTGSYSNSAGTYYTFWQSGAEVSYQAAGSSIAAVFEADGLYDLTLTGGVITAASLQMAYSGEQHVTSATSTYFRTYASGSYTYHYFADDAAVYSAETGKTATLASGDYVIWAEDADGLVTCVYIVD